MKRLITMLTTALVVTAWSDTATVNGITWTYTVSGGKAMVGSSNGSYAVPDSTKGAITIPSTLGGKPVTSIGYQAFSRHYGLTSVTIPDSVMSIGEDAFLSCTNLTCMVIPDSVTSIGKAAFEHCRGLMSVTIGNGVTSIGEQAFYACTGMTSMTIGNGVTSIERLAFYACTSLTSVTIPDSVTSIGEQAFSGCTSLASVTIPDSVQSVGDNCFNSCPAYNASLCKVAWNTPAPSEVALTVTNVVVHYVTASVPSTAVTPDTASTGIVNIISEVNAGAALAVSSDWATQYGEAFTTKFGSDFTKAITAETGKRDAAGKPMMVWQDFVAGTDPTDVNDVFKATIMFDELDNPVIGWTPVLSETEAAKRVYRKYGKVRLQDKDWVEITNGEEGTYNFFKVTVEMR